MGGGIGAGGGMGGGMGACPPMPTIPVAGMVPPMPMPVAGMGGGA